MKDIILYKAMPLLAMLFLSFVNIFKGSVFLVLSLFLIIPYMVHRYKVFKTNKYLLVFFVLSFLGSILNLVGTKNGIGGSINFVVAVGVTLFCIENVNYSRFFVLCLCFYTIWFLYSGIFIQELNIYSIYEDIGLSRNYPGFIMCACCCYWGFFKYLRMRELPFLMPILCTVFAFFLDGRSSLGVLFAMSVICLFYRFKNFTIIFMTLLLVIVLIFLNDIIYYYSLTNIGSNGMETSRYDIWSAYFDNIDLATLIIGVDTMDVPLIRSFGGNPHNAFLNFHYRMGLFGLASLLLIIYRCMKILIKRKHYLLLTMVGLLLVRIFFDACLGSTTDYIIYTIILYPILCNNRVFRKKRQKEIYKKIVRWRQKSQKRNIAMSRVLLNVERYI